MFEFRIFQALLAVAVLSNATPLLRASDLVSDFDQSHLTSEYGPVKKVTVKTPGPVFVDSHLLAFHAGGSIVHIRFAEPVWIIAYETEIFDANGSSPNENYLCHTFFGNRHVEQLVSPGGSAIVPEMKGMFSDAFTRSVRLPDGLGIRLTAGEEIEWMPMFNNRTDDDVRVATRASIHLIRDSELKKPLQSVYAVLESVTIPHLFYVPPGRHQQQITFQLPFNGKIHLIGAHIHPYAKLIEIYDVTGGKQVWKGVVQEDRAGHTSGLPPFSDSSGYPVHAGQSFKLVSTYENPTPYPIDAMAGAFIFYTRD